MEYEVLTEPLTVTKRWIKQACPANLTDEEWSYIVARCHLRLSLALYRRIAKRRLTPEPAKTEAVSMVSEGI